MAFMRAERKLESTLPTAVVPPADPKRDRPRETPPTKMVTKKTGPVGLAKPRVVKLMPEVITLSPPREVRLTTVAGRGKISEPSTAGTFNLDWRCFEYY